MSFELILPFLRPIESLLLDDSVSEIMGNPDGLWWYERRGELRAAPEVRFEMRQLLTSLDVMPTSSGGNSEQTSLYSMLNSPTAAA